ncbi:MAG: hypothetical protein SF053_05395 [Bacteroidia bacterium]|nr:hypothetical protein [Bacteroidia bacterium]
MKQVTFALMIGAVLLTSSCTYPDGPIVSLKTREARVANAWRISYATNASGEDQTSDFESWQYTFSEDGVAEVSYKIAGITLTSTGEWNLIDDGANFQLLFTTAGITTTDEFVILRLTEDEFWIRDAVNEKEEYHLATF